ncbi:MAG: zf-HC2 domain-containing protein [Catenulispora sp.]|nr:zf-HC2 domain-containing protein [Catenulispora sp.]
MECWRVSRVVQSYLDGHTDAVTARRVREHLEVCRRCGLEAETYRAIIDALAQNGRPAETALDRLRAFGDGLLEVPPDCGCG